MSIPTHGPSCVTKAFPIKCPTCASKIFFLQCNHGSKVFFDSLGAPWPIHLCFDSGELQTLIDDLTDINGMYHDEIADRIQEYINSTGESISEDSIRRIQERLGQARQVFRIIQVTPTTEISAITGTIRNIDKDINFFKRINLDKNHISEQLLGVLGKEGFSSLMVREMVRELNIARDYTVFIPTALVAHLRLRKDTKVVLRFDFKNVLDKENIWIVEFIEVLDN